MYGSTTTTTSGSSTPSLINSSSSTTSSSTSADDDDERSMIIICDDDNDLDDNDDVEYQNKSAFLLYTSNNNRNSQIWDEKNVCKDTKDWGKWHKLLLSFTCWFSTYYTMSVLGGAVAYMHFPRYPDADVPLPLPDYGYDIIPEWCPKIGLPLMQKDNIQSEVLMLLYLYFIVYCFCIRKEDGCMIFQQLLHLHCLVFVTRTTTVGVTGFPQPNPRCVGVQHYAVTYWEAFEFVVLRGFPPRACGDLLYSGHVACTLLCVIVMLYHRLYPHVIIRNIILIMATIGTYAVISCRSHYSVDVVMAFYFSFGLSFVYYTIRDYPSFYWIKWLESM